MKAFSRLLKHIPSIKFVGGPHVHKATSGAVKPHPMAPNGQLPGSASGTTSYHNPNPIQPAEGEYFSRSELPLRFRYKAIKDSEIDNVLSGGAEFVY
ncbi:uncharacterized protein SPAPADRAFT_61184 [Spathaspora passalidarum NRRL Y-27907]|uniref:37S ribosomal protein YMR-31, mitochondrial n=1 Tax=Spathaspora passalidarum (strain NRRL Y-27907 / 11-Y1) TaxID=619300 RepID=G3APD3_SPAPN|nr:uncharacterized protein SPAPADRAFT_61184 [Spathaspora passalidarum NRRL Y-27907]EGW32110.1 hypothetical protein SPAPADRAFT_61184 [Spathaspora passalidarum NRRL Y-27907]